MTLTKKDQALMAALRDELLMAKAFRWTPPVPRTVLAPKRAGELTTGWDFNAYSERVYPAWSGVGGHGEGSAPGQHTIGWQETRDLFATKRQALMGMRHELEKQFALTLARIDKQIQEAE
jgi:hypothetical protein